MGIEWRHFVNGRVAGRALLYRAVSILWGNPVGESGGGLELSRLEMRSTVGGAPGAGGLREGAKCPRKRGGLDLGSREEPCLKHLLVW